MTGPQNPSIATPLANKIATGGDWAQAEASPADEFHLLVHLQPGQAEAARAHANRIGADVHGSYDEAMQVTVRADRITKLANGTPIRKVEEQAEPNRDSVSEGVVTTNADELHDIGVKGDNVTVVIIDHDFNKDQNDISDQVIGTVGTLLADFNATDAHGTHCAEIVAEMAPKADLVLASTRDPTYSFTDLMDDITSQYDPDVISMSLTYKPTRRLDGQDDLSKRITDYTTASGTNTDKGGIFVTSAGNYADGEHWDGDWSDPDNTGYMKFQGPYGFSYDLLTIDNEQDEDDDWIDDLKESVLDNEEKVIVQSDADWSTDKSFSLELYDSNKNLIDSFAPTNTPVEQITVPEDAVSYLKIKNESLDGTEHFDIFTWNSDKPNMELGPKTQKRSLGIPATSPDSETLSTGAVHYATENLANYSSRGPTQDGRRGVDIVGPAGTRIDSEGGAFPGTSAACPHVAGAAALLSGVSNKSNDQIRKAMLSTARNTDGYPDDSTPNKKIGKGHVDVKAAYHRLTVELANASVGPNGTYTQDESVEATVDVTNNGDSTFRFFVGHSVYDSKNNAYDNGDQTGTTVELTAGETKQVSVPWVVKDDDGSNAPLGTYDSYIVVWEETDRYNLQTKLDEIRTQDAFEVVEAQGPAAPKNPQPSDDAGDIGTSPTLNWDPGDSSATGVTYDLYLDKGDSNPNTKVASGLSATQYDASLDYGSDYSWQVVAVDNEGRTTAGPVWSFTTEEGTSNLTAPSNPSPQSGESQLTTSLSLSWSQSTSDYSPITYDVYFGTSSNPSFYTSTSSTSVDVSGLQQNTTYYWKVIADDGNGTASSSTLSFSTADGSGSVGISDLTFRNEPRDGPLAIVGGVYSDMDEGYLEYMRETDDGRDYDIRVVNDRGFIVGVDEDDAYANEYAVYLDMNDGQGTIFRTTGNHTADVIVYDHRSGTSTTTSTTTNIGVNHDDGSSPDMTILPVNPQPGEEVSVDVGHFEEDSSGASIEGYEWYILNQDTGTVYKDFSDPNQDKVTFAPSNGGEYYISVSNTGSGYVIDSGEPSIGGGIPEPSLSFSNFSVPSSAVAGESFSASIDLNNSGDATANYIIRFKANGTIHEVEVAEEDPNDSRSESGQLALPEGTHDVEAEAIDSHNNTHNFSSTVTVEQNTQPDSPTLVSPSDGSTSISRQPTLEWSGSDPNDDALTYDIRLDKGNSSPNTTVVSNHGSTTYTPSTLDYGSTYFWQVIATDEHGATTAGPIWEFTTIPSPVEVTISNTNGPVVAGDTLSNTNGPVVAGDTLEIDVGINNTGTESMTETVQVDAGALGSQSSTVTLSGGETQTETFSFETNIGDAGSYSLTAEAKDSRDSRSIELLEAATCNVSITSSNEPVAEGQPLKINAEVTNTGEVDTTCSLTLDVGALGSTTGSVDVSRSGSATKTLSIPTGPNDAGTYTATVSSTDSSDNFSVNVNAAQAAVSASGDRISPGGQATISITAEDIETIAIRPLWVDWTLANSSAGAGSVVNQISTQGDILITYNPLVTSASPSVTVDLPNRYIGGEYLLQVIASNAEEYVSDTAIIDVQ